MFRFPEVLRMRIGRKTLAKLKKSARASGIPVSSFARMLLDTAMSNEETRVLKKVREEQHFITQAPHDDN